MNSCQIPTIVEDRPQQYDQLTIEGSPQYLEMVVKYLEHPLVAPKVMLPAFKLVDEAVKPALVVDYTHQTLRYTEPGINNREFKRYHLPEDLLNLTKELTQEGRRNFLTFKG
jgi:hypothetical protein